MTDSEKALTIYKMLRAEQQRAVKDVIEHTARLAHEATGYKLWREQQGYGGGFEPAGPYNTTHAQAALDRAVKRRELCDELVDYAVATFLDGKVPC